MYLLQDEVVLIALAVSCSCAGLYCMTAILVQVHTDTRLAEAAARSLGEDQAWQLEGTYFD